MVGRDQRVSLLINQLRKLGRSLLLLAYYVAIFVAFVGRVVQWMVNAVSWTGLFARQTASMFDSICRLLQWGRRRSGTKEMFPGSEAEPQ